MEEILNAKVSKLPQKQVNAVGQDKKDVSQTQQNV